jgi:DNA-binding response OmpR family regulator
MKKMKVLVVESEIPTAMMVTSLLTQAGFDVRVAAKGRKGLEIAQEQKFDLIVLETVLPDLRVRATTTSDSVAAQTQTT